MNISRSKFLFRVEIAGLEVEITQTEVPGQVEVHLVELVCIVYVGTCTIVKSTPFLVGQERKFQSPVHAVHLEADVQLVFLGKAEQVIGQHIQVAPVAVSGTYIARSNGWLHFFSCVRVDKAGWY